MESGKAESVFVAVKAVDLKIDSLVLVLADVFVAVVAVYLMNDFPALVLVEVNALAAAATAVDLA